MNVLLVAECDKTTHIGRDKYAVDFLMAEGTPVCAPRDGRVILAKSDSDLGGPSQRFENDANFVVLDHGDGETSFLAHLRKGSLKVKTGETVLAGQIIALQGSTGWTTEPHIHFAVYDKQLGVTVPIRFKERFVLQRK
jgi:murein DD-endopeptidase MepM/ murein hydrolase activator NlpD